LRLLEPVSSEELLARLADVVDRQEAMLSQPTSDEEGVHQRKAFLTCLYIWSFLDSLEPVRGRLLKLLRSLDADAQAMPVDASALLCLPAGSSYADGARAVRRGPVT
jgi:hypothetical protein